MCHAGSVPLPCLLLQVVLTLLLDLAQVLARSDHDQTIELVLLRQQLRRYERQATPPPRRSPWERVPLAAMAARLPDLARVGLSPTPATLPR